MTSSTAAARRDLRELEESIRHADLLLRHCDEVSWSGPAARSYRAALTDLKGRVHRAVTGLDAVELTMTRHLLAVEEAQGRTPLAPGVALLGVVGGGGR